jgi:replicative DNA helicase
MKCKNQKPFNITSEEPWFETASNLVVKAKEHIEKKWEGDGLTGIPSGFHRVDYLTSGWQPGQLIVLAARPGMGKVAFTLSMVYNISVKQGIPLAYFSLEMSSLQLITRLMVYETGLSSEKLRTGILTEREFEVLDNSVENLEKSPLYVIDQSLYIKELQNKAQSLSNYGVKIIVVDYLQLLSVKIGHKTGDRKKEVLQIVRNLKQLATELRVPVIVLSSLSDSLENRSGSKRPLITDLPDYKIIRFYADVISFIYRPEYYQIEEWDDVDCSSTQGQAELIIAWNRNGAFDNIRLKFIGHLGKFEDLDKA